MSDRQPAAGSAALRRYIVTALPSWLVGVLLGAALYLWADVPPWISIAALALWIGADLAIYPRRRRFYESERSSQRMVDEPGIALTDIAPEGFARVHGEIWQARTEHAGDAIRKDAGLRVRGIEGLLLLVDADPEVPHAGPPRSTSSGEHEHPTR